MKIFLSALVFVFIFISACFASSDDVYIRRDVFEAKFERVFDEFARLHKDIEDLKKGQAELAAGQKAIIEELANHSSRINVLSQRIDGLSDRFGDLNHYLYILLVFFGLVIAFPYVQFYLTFRHERRTEQNHEETVKIVEEILRRHKLI